MHCCPSGTVEHLLLLWRCTALCLGGLVTSVHLRSNVMIWWRLPADRADGDAVHPLPQGRQPPARRVRVASRHAARRAGDPVVILLWFIVILCCFKARNQRHHRRQ